MSDAGGSAPARWQLVRERRRRDVADVDDDGDIDVLDEVAGPLEALEAQAGSALGAIVRRVAARGRDEEVRFERDDLLDLQDAMGESSAALPLPGLVARALATHAELVWTTRSVPATFARHVWGSGGVVFAVMDLTREPGDASGDVDEAAGSDADFDDDRLAAVMNRRLAGSGYALAAGGDVTAADREPTAWMWWSVPPARYADRPWHAMRSACPFVGACVGYIGVLARQPRFGACDDLWRALAIAAGGVVARLDDDRARTTVALVRRSLADAVDRRGLDDGDVLLTREPGPYLDDVVARVAAALSDAGVAATAYAAPTAHNPVRLLEGEVPPTLAGLEVELWLRDLSVVEPPCFGALVAPPR